MSRRRKCNRTDLMEKCMRLVNSVQKSAKEDGSDGVMFSRAFPEEALLGDELDLSAEPAESELGFDAFEEVVFGDDTYNTLCESIRGERIWDLPEDYR